jgi:hypothetical protein
MAESFGVKLNRRFVCGGKLMRSNKFGELLNRIEAQAIFERF